MTICYQDESVTLHHGNCLDILAELPDASVDSVVTDPPYGLANTTPEKIAETVMRWVTGERDYLPGGKGFMGNPWDAFVPPAAVWDDCLRVLKPGGHVLAFAGSRTMDLMGLSLRMAGFDIRDSIAWLYGSGFPKSLDVSKAIDKARRDDPAWREVGQWLKSRRLSAGYATRTDFAHLILDGHKNLESAAANLSNWENGLSFPTWERWTSLKALLSLPDDMDAEVWRLNGRKGKPGEAWDLRPVTGIHRAGLATGTAGVGGGGDGGERRDQAATDEARAWQGWGTALKPAFEPVVVARKPLAGTVAANLLGHGTGALNIDGCRKGERWPANVVLDDHQAAHLAESRFFYVAKAGRGERPNVGGIVHPTVKPLALMRWLVRLVTPPGGTVLEPFAGSGTTIEAALLEGFNVIGVEREAEYLPLIEARIARAHATDTDLFGGAA